MSHSESSKEGFIPYNPEDYSHKRSHKAKFPGKPWNKEPLQREKLEAYFNTVSAYPEKTAIAVIADELGLSFYVVKHWFMNQRAKGNVEILHWWILMSNDFNP